MLNKSLSCAENMRPMVGGGEEIRAGYFKQYSYHFKIPNISGC